MRMYFQRGIDETDNMLKLFVGRTLEKTIPAIQDQAAQEILDLAVQLCPVDTGSLQQSGRVEENVPEDLMDEEGLSYMPRRRVAVIFGGDEDYYLGGGRENRQPGVRPVDYGPYVEYGTAISPAQPFLTPAAEQVYPLYVERVRAALGNGE